MKKKRVVAYCRVSTLFEEQENSLVSQINYYQNLFLQDSNLISMGIFFDSCSGLNMKNRNGYQIVLKLIESRNVDIVYCKGISRLSRDVVETLRLVELCIENKVILNIGGRDYANLIDMRFELTMLAMLAQNESEQKSKAIRWAYRRGFQRGRVYMTKLYGYETNQMKIIINQEEAEIVKEAYKLYLNGMSETKIAEIFNGKGYKTKYGNSNWNYSKIKNMLTNIKYTGATIGPKSYSKDFLNKKRFENNCFDQYYLEESHSAIISMTTYNEAQEFRENIEVTGGRKRQDETALSRKIICGICGNTYRRKQFYNRNRTIRSVEWKCGTRALDKGKCDCSPLIKESYLLEIVIKEIIKQTYLDIIDDSQMGDIKNENIIFLLNQYVEKIIVYKDDIKIYLNIY